MNSTIYELINLNLIPFLPLAKDIMYNINAFLALTNKLREIDRPMPELHIINLIVSSVPESYARARSNWSLVPESNRTIGKLTSSFKAEETIIKSFAKPATETALAAYHGKSIIIMFKSLTFKYPDLNYLYYQMKLAPVDPMITKTIQTVKQKEDGMIGEEEEKDVAVDGEEEDLTRGKTNINKI